jgi:hypothetical protein
MQKSVMEVFDELEKNNARVVYVNNYNRITPKVTETFGVFKADSELTLTPVKAILNEKEANISLKNVINGVVTLNPNTAKRVGLEDTIRSFRYHTQTYVCDNKINIPTMDVVIPKKFVGNMDFLENVQEYSENEVRANISLVGRPTFDTTKAVTNKSLYEMLKELNVSKLKKKVADYLYEDFKTYSETYTEEQKNVLFDHGIRPTGEYGGVGNKKEAKGARMCRTIVLAIDQLGTILSVKKMQEQVKSGGKLNAYHLILQEELNKQENIIASMDNEEKKTYLEGRTNQLKHKIEVLKRRFIVDKNIALLTGTLFENTIKKSNAKYFADFEDGSLVINDKIATVEV